MADQTDSLQRMSSAPLFVSQISIPASPIQSRRGSHQSMQPISSPTNRNTKNRKHSLPPRSEATENKRHSEEVQKIINLANLIRSQCVSMSGKTKCIDSLLIRVKELIEFYEEHFDDERKMLDSAEVTQCNHNIVSTLTKAKYILQNVSKVKWRRNAKFKTQIKPLCVALQNDISTLETLLSGDATAIQNYQNNRIMSREQTGELELLAAHRAFFGHSVAQNYTLAFEYYRKSAEMENADGITHLAQMFEKGLGCIAQINEAISLYKKAILLGNIDAALNLAQIYTNDPFHQNITKAIHLYTQAAQNGNCVAMTALGNIYENGISDQIEPQMDICLKWYRDAANCGHRPAQNNLAVLLLNGEKDSSDVREGIALLCNAAEAGNASAQNNLGYSYETGKGVDIDLVSAMEWYQKAAAQNHTGAHENIGFLYLKKKIYDKAFNHFCEASKALSVTSWYYLGLMHEKGYFVACNPALAVGFYQKAADAGDEEALLKLADSFFSGNGSKLDLNKAFEMYQRLAIEGNAIAGNNLGIMYEEGLGTDKDLQSAKIWFEFGTEKNYEPAQHNLQRLIKTITVQQLRNNSV